MAKIKTISTVEAPQEWTVEYEVDFSAESAHDFQSTATATIKGVDWTAINADETATFDLDASTGLRIFASPSSGPWYGSGLGPMVAAKIKDMMTNLKEHNTIAIQLQIKTAADVSQNYHSYGLGLWDGTEGDANGFALSRRVYDGAKKDGFIVNTSQDLTSESDQSDFFEIVWFPGDGQILSVGTMGTGDWPVPLSTTAVQGYNSMHGQGPGDSGGSGGSLTWRIPYDTAAAAIFCYAQNSIAQLDATAYKIRVLRRG